MIKVHDGTTSIDLCETCSNALHIKGHRGSEEKRYCLNSGKLINIEFKVSKCSDYHGKDYNDKFGSALFIRFDSVQDCLMVSKGEYQEMEPLKDFMTPKTSKNKKKAGFDD